MLPGALVAAAVERIDAEILPRYFSERDYPWLRALLDEYARHAGRRRAELGERLAEPLPVRAPRSKLRIAIRVLDHSLKPKTVARLRPRTARAAAFRARTALGDRQAALAASASEFGVDPAELERALFADLPGERRVPSPEEVSPADLARDANAALVASLVARAVQVRLRVWGDTRAVVRHARLLGLICVVRSNEVDPGPVEIEISGPFSLFRRTELYGRALASLVPRLCWCARYELQASCALPGSSVLWSLVLKSGDPIAPARELPRYDSKLEERFARDLSKLTLDWFVVREPRPVRADGTLIFPDFELRHRHHPERTWLVEIAGFWTAPYLEQKLARLRAAGLDRLILCIDAERRCSEGVLPAEAHVVAYRRRIDARAVLAIVNG